MTERNSKGQFKKGQSGNPGGRKKDPVWLVELAREFSEESLMYFVSVLRSKSKNVTTTHKLKAAELLLDRGLGKPKQGFDLEGAEGIQINVNVREKTRDGD